MNAAVGRLCLGLSFAQSSRYTNYLALGIFGGYLHLLSLNPRKRQQVTLAVLSVVLLFTIPIRADDRNTMRFFSNIKRSWRTCYLGGGSISRCDHVVGYKIAPEPSSVLQQKLDYLQHTDQNLFCTHNRPWLSRR
jgi:hypothetical protein